MLRRGRVVVLGAIGAALALYLLYLGGANLYLRSGSLERALSRRPQVVYLHYDAAWTLFPGRVHVRGFRLGGQTRNFQWWLAIDQATLDLVLPRLLFRQVEATGVSGEGVGFRIARRADAAVPWSSDPRLRAPIPGFVNPPLPAPEQLYPSTSRPAPGRPEKTWRIALSGIDLAKLREVWIETMRWTGDGRVRGGFDLEIRRRLTIGPSEVQVAEGDLAEGGSTILQGLRGTIEGSSEPFDPVADAGRPAFRHLDARARLAGRIAGLGFLAPFLRPVPGLAVEGSGPLDLDLRLARGRFEPGTRAGLRAERVRVGVLAYQATGAGRVSYRVVGRVVDRRSGAGGGRRGELAIVVDRFALERDGYRGAYARGSDLRLTAWSAPPGLDHPFTPTALDVAIPRAEVPDFATYDSYLPARSGVALLGGHGRLRASLHAEGPAWKGRADLRIDGHGITADVLGARLGGELALESHVARLDLLRQRYDLAGTELALTGVTLAAEGAVHVEPGWWARARIERGELMPGKPIFLVATTSAKLRDAGPIVALLAPKSRLLGWLDRRLVEKAADVRAEVTGKLGARLIEVDRLEVAGGPLAVQGHLRFAGAVRRAALLASYGRLAVGLELAGGERRVKVVGARRWFEEIGRAGGEALESERRGGAVPRVRGIPPGERASAPQAGGSR